ncbi:unnamed protein product [Lymnaea stagnalis]|uniref:Uncharacterized protein n=1 Tax=Lymnaea stagnalis TaxID=6523 RepID=A0AAV2HP79_LYMST
MLAFKVLLLTVVLLVVCTECQETSWKGGCRGTQYGCCDDGRTPAGGPNKENCVNAGFVGGCAGTRYGCCSDGVTSAAGDNGEECPDLIVS